MGNEALLDHRAYPHVVDRIFVFAPPESLFVMNQVCREWRNDVASIFRHLGRPINSDQTLVVLNNGQHLEYELVVKDPRYELLLQHCRRLDMFAWNEMPDLTPAPLESVSRLFPKLHTARMVFAEGAEALVDPIPRIVLHDLFTFRVNRKPYPRQTRDILLNTEKLVVVQRVCENALYYARFVFSDALRTVVFYLDVEEITRDYARLAEEAEIHEPGCPAWVHGDLSERCMSHVINFVRELWEKAGKSVTVVGAERLDPGPAGFGEWEIHAHPSCDEMLEAIRAEIYDVTEIPLLPGPVGPVHFITVEAYREAVGEEEFKIETEKLFD